MHNFNLSSISSIFICSNLTGRKRLTYSLMALTIFIILLWLRVSSFNLSNGHFTALSGELVVFINVFGIMNTIYIFFNQLYIGRKCAYPERCHFWWESLMLVHWLNARCPVNYLKTVVLFGHHVNSTKRRRSKLSKLSRAKGRLWMSACFALIK